MSLELNWVLYINQMEQILSLNLDDISRVNLLIQCKRIAIIAEPLMMYKLDDRLEVAGVFHP
ncbi:oxalurate catabolism protein HpxX [Candidatus Pantoea carbekii]|uniref:Uncharacterized protein n=1 Tax=Candidatus Pantoea carbekii TaxID=1235990 RepID=U3U8Q4_9GAMM|nr:oxalurate catabolism protein HpxX [Candidatus Pantoea carbekii]AKC32253.1 hypothetical protein BMSBPS_0453 [Candidatus Pantoea carbekii]BAO00789.1 hypothetical protein HHS_08190 [Candidatus Pantoea carbekii]